MKEPIKPGIEASKTKDGGSLGNIDEITGHPGKSTGGASLKLEESGTDSSVKATHPTMNQVAVAAFERTGLTLISENEGRGRHPVPGRNDTERDER